MLGFNDDRYRLKCINDIYGAHLCCKHVNNELYNKAIRAIYFYKVATIAVREPKQCTLVANDMLRAVKSHKAFQ